jgi:hypothetical protein
MWFEVGPKLLFEYLLLHLDSIKVWRSICYTQFNNALDNILVELENVVLEFFLPSG